MIDGNNGNDVHNDDAMALDPPRGRPTSTMTPNPATDSPTPMYAVLNGNASTMTVAGTGSLSGIGGGWRYYTISRGPTTAAVGARAASHLQRSTTSTAAAAAATMATGDGDDEGGSKYLFSDRATCCDMWFCVHGACLDGGELGGNSSTCRPTRTPPTTSTMSV